MRARYPDAGQELRLLYADKTLRTVMLDPADVAGFTNADLTGSSMVTSIKWAESYLRVKGVSDKTVDGIAVKSVSFLSNDSLAFTRGGLEILPRTTYHFENAKAFLNARGEWYQDETAGIIYYLPYENETLENTTVRIPQTETLFTLQGESGGKIENVKVEGLNFAYTANASVDGKLGGQANGRHEIAAPTTLGEKGRPASAVTMNYVENVTFQKNNFYCLGGGGIDLLFGGSSVSIQENVFRAVGGNGLLVGTLQTDAAVVLQKFANDSQIANTLVNATGNYFTEIGWQEYGACGIVYTYASNCTIANNTIKGATYTGISYGWGWETWLEKTYETVGSKKTLVDVKRLGNEELLGGGKIYRNVLTNVTNFLNDGGAIYLAGNQPNTVVYENYIANTYNSVYKYASDRKTSNVDGTGADQIWWANAGIYFDTAAEGTNEENAVKAYDNYVAADVANQQYEFCNAIDGLGVGYFTINGKSGDGLTIAMDNTVTAEATLVAAGATVGQPTKPTLFGTRTTATEFSVYGVGFGDTYNGKLTVNGESVRESEIISWTDGEITFASTAYESVNACAQFGDSNRVYGAMNVDYTYDSTTRFESYGGYAGLLAMQCETLAIKEESFAASSTYSINGYEYSPSLIADGYAWSGWSMKTADETGAGAWVSFELETASTVSLFLLYDRTDTQNQTEIYRSKFSIIGITEDGAEITLFTAGSEQAYDNNGMLTLDIAASDYADTVFKGFKLKKTDNGYFYVAEVAVI